MRRPFLLPASHDAYQEAFLALVAGDCGVCIVGAVRDDRVALLARVMESLPRDRFVVAQLDPAATARQVEAALAQGAAARVAMGAASRAVLVVDDAEQLHDDTLAVLNEVAAVLIRGNHSTRLLLAGTPELLGRLSTGAARSLEAHLAARVDMPDPVSQTAVWSSTGPSSMRWSAGKVFGVSAFVTASAVMLAPSLRHGSVWRNGDHASPAAMVSPQLRDFQQSSVQDIPQRSVPPIDDETDAAASRTEPAFDADPLAPGRSGSAERSSRGNSSLGTPGLLLVARQGDTLQRLYRSVYDGVRPPAFQEVANANPHPVRPGTVLVFPTPPDGWRKP